MINSTNLENSSLNVYRKRIPESSAPINGPIHVFAIHFLLLADLLYSSRLYRIIDVTMVQPIVLGICASFCLAYLTLAVVRGYIAAAALFVVAVSLIIGQLYLFSSLAGTSVNLNAGFQFCWTFTFIVFFIIARDGYANYLACILAWYATAYAGIYASLAFMLTFEALDSSIFLSMMADDIERGQRLFNYIVACAYAWFYWLNQLKSKHSAFALFMATLCGIAIAMTLSRVAILLIVCVSIGFIFSWRLRTIGMLSFAFFLGNAFIMLFGVFNSDWNPFDLFQADSSGLFRMWEYSLARDFLRAHPLFGIGIPPAQTDTWAFVKQDYFAPSDLGALGVWFDFGLLGLIAFIAGSFIVCQHKLPVDKEFQIPLVLTGCLMSAYGSIAPVILYPGGATYFALLLGFYLHNHSRKKSIY